MMKFFTKIVSHFQPITARCCFSIAPKKHQKTFRFSDVFRGYRKATAGCNGLIIRYFWKKTNSITDVWQYSLRKKCPYSELLWSVFSRIRSEYGEIQSISTYSVRMQENTDQNNSEYGHFSRIVSRYTSGSPRPKGVQKSLGRRVDLTHFSPCSNL